MVWSLFGKSDWSCPLSPPQNLLSRVTLSMVATPSEGFSCPHWRSDCLSPTGEQKLDIGEQVGWGLWGSGAQWAVSGQHCPGPLQARSTSLPPAVCFRSLGFHLPSVRSVQGVGAEPRAGRRVPWPCVCRVLRAASMHT